MNKYILIAPLAAALSFAAVVLLTIGLAAMAGLAAGSTGDTASPEEPLVVKTFLILDIAPQEIQETIVLLTEPIDKYFAPPAQRYHSYELRFYQRLWLDPNFIPPTDALDALVASLAHYGNSLAIYYHNLETGFRFTHHPHRIFFAASVSKANHALYVYTLAEQGKLDMQALHTYTRYDWFGGSGVMQFMPAGTQFTTRELLGYSIIESDNVAYRMLIRYTANQAFSYHDFVEELGADPRLVLDVYSQNATAADVALWMYAIYRYTTSDSRYGHYFLHDLTHTSEHYIRAHYPIAQKYGFSRGFIHDAAIVYAPSPYILVILTRERIATDTLFEEISWAVADFNRQWFDRMPYPQTMR